MVSVYRARVQPDEQFAAQKLQAGVEREPSHIRVAQAAGSSLAAMAAVVYTISFAAVAYGGDLAPFLDWGIGLVLIGTAAAVMVAGVTSSTRGMVSHPE